MKKFAKVRKLKEIKWDYKVKMNAKVCDKIEKDYQNWEQSRKTKMTFRAFSYESREIKQTMFKSIHVVQKFLM